MIGCLVRWLGRYRVERLATAAVLDGLDPIDVDPVARYLWAMCDGTSRTEPDSYALAAVLWLVYGRLEPAAIPLKAARYRLTAKQMDGLPPPYRDRITTT